MRETYHVRVQCWDTSWKQVAVNVKIPKIHNQSLTYPSWLLQYYSYSLDTCHQSNDLSKVNSKPGSCRKVTCKPLLTPLCFKDFIIVFQFEFWLTHTKQQFGSLGWQLCPMQVWCGNEYLNQLERLVWCGVCCHGWTFMKVTAPKLVKTMSSSCDKKTFAASIEIFGHGFSYDLKGEQWLFGSCP